MNQDIHNSLAKLKAIEARQDLSENTAAAPVAKAAGKGLGRFIPGVGLALGAADAYSRAKQGDYTGAALSGLGGVASLIPGVGTAASLGLAGAQAARDKARTGSWMPDDEEQAAAVARDKQAQPAQAAAPAAAKPAAPAQAAAPAGADPKVVALQKQLIAQGAKIKADGIMGPQTQAAMKQFPNVAVAESKKETKMTESDKIAALRSKLAQLESRVDEGPLDFIKGAYNTGKAALSGAKFGAANPSLTSRLAPKNPSSIADKTGVAAAKAAGAVARNPVKSSAAAGALGAAGTMAAMSGNKPAAPAKPPVGGKPAAAKPAAAPAQTANAGPDQKDVDELNKLAADLENSQDPADIELLKRYSGIINAINNRSAGDKRTQGEIAAAADMNTGAM